MVIFFNKHISTYDASHYSRCWDTVLRMRTDSCPHGVYLVGEGDKKLVHKIISASAEFHGEMKLVLGSGVMGWVGRRRQRKTPLRRWHLSQKMRTTNHLGEECSQHWGGDSLVCLRTREKLAWLQRSEKGAAAGDSVGKIRGDQHGQARGKESGFYSQCYGKALGVLSR